MYESYFNLKRNPFEITPDPSFLFPTKQHNEALAALYYGVRWQKGFVVLTGEVGTGKTFLLRCLLQLLKQGKDVSYAYLFSSRLTAFEFLQYIVSDFGLPASGKNKAELLLDLCNYVVARALKNLTTVLIVDEAHHLSSEALEEVRLLTNLETTEHKLLQIVLVGQPELDNILDSAKLTQLKQRIAIRSSLHSLTLDETKGYIWRRLEFVGANSHAQTIFPATTIASIFRHSRGIPRLINTLCENALISAYARQVKSISPEIVDGVAQDLRLDVLYEPPNEQFRASDEMDFRRAARVLFDVYASLSKPVAYESSRRTTPVLERVRQA